MTLHNYTTGQVIRELTGEEETTYLAMLAELPSSQREVGAVPGAAFGVEFTVYAA